MDPLTGPILLPDDAVLIHPRGCPVDSGNNLLLVPTESMVVTTRAMGLVGTVYMRDGPDGEWWRWHIDLLRDGFDTEKEAEEAARLRWRNREFWSPFEWPV